MLPTHLQIASTAYIKNYGRQAIHVAHGIFHFFLRFTYIYRLWIFVLNQVGAWFLKIALPARP